MRSETGGTEVSTQKMTSLLLVVALCGALGCALPIGPEDGQISDKEMEFAKKYMENYYPDSENVPVPRSITSDHPIAAAKIREMQRLFGLQVTGKVDSMTLDLMKKPRCGVPDIGEFRTFPGSPKWPKKALTYSIENYTRHMRRADVDKAIEKAWKLWSDVTPLTFTRVYDGSADIKISFVVGNHGDPFPFDRACKARAFSPGNHGLSGDAHFDDYEFWSKDLKGHGNSKDFHEGGCVLAHAFPPYRGYRREAHFNDDVHWTKDLSETNLLLVAAHEFGHTLGLSHSNVSDALMFKRYQADKFKNFRLHQDDIDGIQSLYGPRVNSPSVKTMLPPPEAPLQELGNQDDQVPNLKKRTRSPKIPDIQAKIPEM